MNLKQETDFIIRIPGKIFKKDMKDFLSKINFRSIKSNSVASQKEIEKSLLLVKKQRGGVIKPLLDRIKDKV